MIKDLFKEVTDQELMDAFNEMEADQESGKPTMDGHMVKLIHKLGVNVSGQVFTFFMLRECTLRWVRCRNEVYMDPGLGESKSVTSFVSSKEGEFLRVVKTSDEVVIK